VNFTVVVLTTMYKINLSDTHFELIQNKLQVIGESEIYVDIEIRARSCEPDEISTMRFRN
jgi:hypothetical protein